MFSVNESIETAYRMICESETLDEQYEKAVKSGDDERALQMIADRAKSMGYKIEAYHGTELEYFGGGKPWNVFDDLSHFGSKDVADRVSRSKAIESYGSMPYVFHVFLKMENPKRVKDTPVEWDDTHSEYWYAEAKKAVDEGFDSIVYENEYENVVNGDNDDSFIPFYRTQIKSAEITYDNDGKLIPLSQRFNQTKPDIRY